MGDDQIVISSGQVITPETIASRGFTAAFRGFHPAEVRQFLKRVSDEMAASAGREVELRRALQDALARAAHPEVDEATLTTALGEHAARLLTSARETAVTIIEEAGRHAAELQRDTESRAAKVRAEADGLLSRRVAEAHASVVSIRQAAEAEAQARIDQATELGREMVAEARAVRERMLGDLSRRRRTAQVQIEQLRAGRERLVAAYDVVRRTVDEATAELDAAEPEARLAAEAVARRAEEPDNAAPVVPAPATAPVTATATPMAPGRGSGDGMALLRRVEPKPAPPERPRLRPQTVAAAADRGVAPAQEVAADPAPVAGLPAEEPAPAPVAELPVPEPDAELPASAPEPGTNDLESVPEIPEVEPEAVVEIALPEAVSETPVTESVPVPPTVDETAPASPAPASDPTTGEVPAVDVGPGNVEELFARIRAARTDAPVPAAPPAAPPQPLPLPVLDVVAEEQAIESRDGLLDNLEAGLARALKRVLGDEQNEVLDGLRRMGLGDGVLPDAAAQRAGYAGAAAPWLQQAARAGAGFVSEPSPEAGVDEADPSVEAHADALARDLIEPLRERLGRVLAGAGDVDDPAAVAESLRATYRQWKVGQVEECARHHVVAAFNAGAFAATPDAATLRWLVDDDGPCPDCDDNALAGPTAKGEEFPTGQLHPPAHPGCRCLLVPVTA